MKTWQKLKHHPELIERYFVREQVIDTMRHFFKSQHFHEVFTPTLVPTPSCEPNLEVFTTELRTQTGKQRPGYLIMSPEFAIKKLLSAGIGDVFEIARCFRNEEDVSDLHNPEFTMLEWYRTNSDYTAIMTDVESLVTSILTTVQPNSNVNSFTYQDQQLDFSLPWPRYSVAEAFAKYCQVDVDTLLSPEKLAAAAASRGFSVTADTTWEQLFYQYFFNDIEPALKASGRPAFIYDYPVSQASLSRKKPSDPRFAERFEIFIAGLEIGNCFTELTDPVEQSARFTADFKERQRLGKTIYPMDKDLIAALESGLPPVSGIAVGVDRLVMLAANVPSIADTLFFPAVEEFDLS